MSGLEATGAGGASWEALARSAAAERETVAEIDGLRQLLTFTMGGTPYAIPVESVREIVRIRPITPVPRVASDVRGVISLRGEIIQVVDLCLRLGLPSAETTRASRIVVVQPEDGRVAGVLVDSVQEVLRVSEDAIGPASDGGAVEALCARGDEFVSLLDLERVLEIDDEH